MVRITRGNAAADVDTSEFIEDEGDGRRWVRHRITGQAGWIVTKDGKSYVHPDRPSGVNLVPYKKGEWLEERDRRTLTRYQIASVAFEADKALCVAMNLTAEYRPWVSLSGDERQRWRDAGPEGKLSRTPRQTLWRTIMNTMQKEFA
jgi:hypothetical protein